MPLNCLQHEGKPRWYAVYKYGKGHCKVPIQLKPAGNQTFLSCMSVVPHLFLIISITCGLLWIFWKIQKIATKTNITPKATA